MGLLDDARQQREYSKIFKSTANSNGIFMDGNNRLWKYGFLGIVRSYDDIVDINIYENGSSSTKTKTGSMIGRAAIGSLINPAGAIIGGLTAKKKHIEVINNIEILVTTKDIKNPIFRIDIPIKKGTKKDSKDYLRAIKKAQALQSTLLAIANN